jgi:hypothetical protein
LGFLMRFIIWNTSQIWIIKKLLIVEIGDLGGYLLEVAMCACAIFQFVVEVWLIALKPK